MALQNSTLTLVYCQSDGGYVEALWAPMQYVQTLLVGFALGRGGSYILIRASSKEALYWAVTGDRFAFGLSLMRLCIGLVLAIGFALGWHW